MYTFSHEEKSQPACSNFKITFPYATKIALIQFVYTVIAEFQYREITTIIREHIEMQSVVFD